MNRNLIFPTKTLEQQSKTTARKNSCRILYLLILLFPVAAWGQKQPAEQDKQLLVDMLYSIELTQDLVGQISAPINIGRLKREIKNVSLDQYGLFKNRSDYLDSRRQLDYALQHKLTLIRQRELMPIMDTVKTVEFPEPDELSECSGWSNTVALALLGDKLVADSVLSYAKWGCMELVLGENAALTCVALEIYDDLATTAYEFADFCVKDAHYAENSALAQTVNSIGEHMNEFIDDTTVSSRATQDTVDTLQDSIDTTNTSLDQYLPILDDNLNTALTDLDEANSKINNINAQADSLLFRVQINQVEIEETEIATSDIQQRAEEIRDDTQSLIVDLNNLQTQLSALNQQTQSLISGASNNQIEFVLARNSDIATLDYQLPIAHGGLLEQVREVLIAKLNAIEAAGGVIKTAQNYFASGDAEFNNKRYKSAFNNYSLAYQALLETTF